MIEKYLMKFLRLSYGVPSVKLISIWRVFRDDMKEKRGNL